MQKKSSFFAKKASLKVRKKVVKRDGRQMAFAMGILVKKNVGL